jgi:hypothetical protein
MYAENMISLPNNHSVPNLLRVGTNVKDDGILLEALGLRLA